MEQERSSELHLSKIAWYTVDKDEFKIEDIGTLIGANRTLPSERLDVTIHSSIIPRFF